MQVQIAYGKQGLMLNLPDDLNLQVITPEFVPGLADPQAAFETAFEKPYGCPPLRELAGAEDRIGIIFNDITRATPNDVILKAILKAIPHVPAENIILFDALGTHRPNTDAELRKMLGDDLVNNYRIVQNNSFEKETQVHLGVTSSGNQVWINRELTECDLVILTGFIEPHFFAGFSGGGKAIMPGMAGLDTILGNHSARTLDNSNSIWGVTQGNPLWEEIHEIAGFIKNKFLVNVTLNNQHEITAIFAGDLAEAHQAGTEFVRKTCMVPVEKPFDIVITSNSGYPLDLNLYQTVKGISAAGQVVRQGGTIIAAAECWDGLPAHGLFGQLLREFESPQALLERIRQPDFAKLDQWQAHILCRNLLKARIYLHTDNLSEEEIRAVMLQPAPSIETLIVELLEVYGKDASICILPEGPLTIPYLQN